MPQRIPSTNEIADNAYWTRAAYEYFDFPTSSNPRVLDLGCGQGYRTSRTGCRLPQHAGSAIGVDINRAQLTYAQRNHADSSFVQTSMEQLPFDDNTFDGVFSFSVLQYVDWRAVTLRLKELLKPGGKIALVEQLAQNPIAVGYRHFHSLVGLRHEPDQNPLGHISWRDLAFFEQHFDNVQLTPVYLSVPINNLVPALLKGITGKPRQVKTERLFRTLYSVDKLIIERVPSVHKYCWQVMICATNRG